MSRIQRIFAWGAFTLVLMLLSGWLLADHLTPRAVGALGHALAVRDGETALDRSIAPLVARHDGMTGAILLPDGLDAFASRALSARQAGRSLDLQYYIWHNDLTGRLLGREVYMAAQRGVRVRMLLDDMNGAGNDVGLMALDAHPNIEIRLYNPFRNRGGVWRMLEMVQRIYSVNHRMHNKAWIADGRVAVLGGRNIGEEYFDASTETNFRDLDILLFGPKVAQASAVFDAYWNSEGVVPIAALADKYPRELDKLVGRVREEALGPKARRYLSRMDGSKSVRGYVAQRLTPYWSHHIEVVSDPPLKWKGDTDRSTWLATRLAREISGTRHKALLISPYFVPGDASTAGLVGLVRDRRAQVCVITNSLAANDVPAVYSGYVKYRKRLLDGGVCLYEIRAEPKTGDGKNVARSGSGSDGDSGSDSGSGGLFGSSGASLHTKAFVIDDRRGFVGSYNLDPRSANLNTEMGVLFDDARIGRGLRDEYRRLSAPQLSYWVTQDQAGDPRWLDRTTQPPSLLDQAPGSTRLQRTIARVLGWLPIESQL